MVAAMSVAGMGLSARAADNMGDNTAQAVNNTGTQLQTTGGQIADESAAKEARRTLARIVNDGVETDKFSSFTSYLAKADRQRFGDVKQINQDDLNNAIKQFRQDFKDKYNQDFDISADQLSNAMVYAGTDKNSATVTLSKPLTGSTPGDVNTSVNNTMSSTNNTANNPSGATADRTLNTAPTDQTVSNRSGDNSAAGLTSTSAGARTGSATNGSNSNSTVHGNDVTATPGVAANVNDTSAMHSSTNGQNTMANANSTGMSSVTLNFVNEGHLMNSWRISDPQISAEQLKQNLVKHIQMLDDQKAAWPSDVNAAYKAVAYHVLSSFNDTAMATER
jgi:hypothetical protein